jgi:hypothetical protein
MENVYETHNFAAFRGRESRTYHEPWDIFSPRFAKRKNEAGKMLN